MLSAVQSKTAKASVALLTPITDTVSGAKARAYPQETLAHYEKLAQHLWLAPEIEKLANATFAQVKEGRTAWASLSGSYGFGKTAATVTLWHHAKQQGFLAIPPLSCTSFDELAHGVASLAAEQLPAKARKQVRALFADLWTEEIEHVARREAAKYEMTPKQLRRLLEDKLDAGQLTIDSQCYRLVQFLSELSLLATTQGKSGLLVILDEVQQLLGPLDARSVIKFREFVWGMRTERAPCGVVIALDALLEARLARWASDILHRIRDSGLTLQMSHIYSREFPAWLWHKLTTPNGNGVPSLDTEALSPDMLTSLGQFVERPDLANGPRTVVDVFARAQQHFAETRISYGITRFVEDIREGKFRYFGEGAPVQNLLLGLLKDEWVVTDAARREMVMTLAAFPHGCPHDTLARCLPISEQRERARSELFAPLLVELSTGTALEPLQQIRRTRMTWEQTLARCWETLPALDALAAHAPSMASRVLLPRLFPKGSPSSPTWARTSDDESAELTGWHVYVGTFDDAFPQRVIAVQVARQTPSAWRKDVDLCIAFVCDDDLSAEPSATLEQTDDMMGIAFHLPMLKPLHTALPGELERCVKFVQPEPFRPATILAALHDLEAYLGDLLDPYCDDALDINEQRERRHAAAFAATTLDFVMREMLQGTVPLESKRTIRLGGIELVRALFAVVCRRRYPRYETLIRTPRWCDALGSYRSALSHASLTFEQRQGRTAVTGTKADLMTELFRQQSTAAGDSFVRLLGSFISTCGTPDEFSITLALHPAESALLQYLRSTKSKKSVPLEAACELLRHQGYTRDETDQIVQTLAAREMIACDAEGNIRLTLDAEAARADLLKRIAELEKRLAVFGQVSNISIPSGDATPNELQQSTDALAARLLQSVNEQIESAKAFKHESEELTGAVVAAQLKLDWDDSDIISHLRGAATLLSKQRDELVKALRKEAHRVEVEIEESSRDVETWARAWQQRQGKIAGAGRNNRERALQLLTRAEMLAAWTPLNHRLRAVKTSCMKLKEILPEFAVRYERFAEAWRERMMSATWEAFSASMKFDAELQQLQEQTEKQLFSLSQIFERERAALIAELHLFTTTEITLRFSVDERESVNRSFARLYERTLEVCDATLAEFRRRRETGEAWRSKQQPQSSWNKIHAQVDAARRACGEELLFKNLLTLATKLAKLSAGFASQTAALLLNDTSEVYANPQKPPNFARLEEMFKQGQIRIVVAPR